MWQRCTNGPKQKKENKNNCLLICNLDLYQSEYSKIPLDLISFHHRQLVREESSFFFFPFFFFSEAAMKPSHPALRIAGRAMLPEKQIDKTVRFGTK